MADEGLFTRKQWEEMGFAAGARQQFREEEGGELWDKGPARRSLYGVLRDWAKTSTKEEIGMEALGWLPTPGTGAKMAMLPFGAITKPEAIRKIARGLMTKGGKARMARYADLGQTVSSRGVRKEVAETARKHFDWVKNAPKELLDTLSDIGLTKYKGLGGTAAGVYTPANLRMKLDLGFAGERRSFPHEFAHHASDWLGVHKEGMTRQQFADWLGVSQVAQKFQREAVGMGLDRKQAYLRSPHEFAARKMETALDKPKTKAEYLKELRRATKEGFDEWVGWLQKEGISKKELYKMLDEESKHMRRWVDQTYDSLGLP